MRRRRPTPTCVSLARRVGCGARRWSLQPAGGRRRPVAGRADGAACDCRPEWRSPAGGAPRRCASDRRTAGPRPRDVRRRRSDAAPVAQTPPICGPPVGLAVSAGRSRTAAEPSWRRSRRSRRRATPFVLLADRQSEPSPGRAEWAGPAAGPPGAQAPDRRSSARCPPVIDPPVQPSRTIRVASRR